MASFQVADVGRIVHGMCPIPTRLVEDKAQSLITALLDRELLQYHTGQLLAWGNGRVRLRARVGLRTRRTRAGPTGAECMLCSYHL